MAGPSWLAATFAAVMLATAAYCASRLAAARRWGRATEHDVDLMHAVMGVAMAGMLVPRLSLLRYGGWELVFSAATGWFGWQIIRSRRGRPGGSGPAPGSGPVAGQGPAAAPGPAHHVPHLLACGAMLYMFLAAGPARTGTGLPGLPGMAADGPAADVAHSPGLALPLALAVLGYVIWMTDRLTALPRVAALATRIPAPVMTARSAGNLAAFGSGSADLPDGRRTRPGAVRQQAGRVPMSPRLAACCEIAMGVTMGYMLIQML